MLYITPLVPIVHCHPPWLPCPIQHPLWQKISQVLFWTITWALTGVGKTHTTGYAFGYSGEDSEDCGNVHLVLFVSLCCEILTTRVSSISSNTEIFCDLSFVIQRFHWIFVSWQQIKGNSSFVANKWKNNFLFVVRFKHGTKIYGAGNNQSLFSFNPL